MWRSPTKTWTGRKLTVLKIVNKMIKFKGPDPSWYRWNGREAPDSLHNSNFFTK